MMSKKSIGAVVGLYPTPVTVIGTVIDNKVNWINIAHVGVLGLENILVSINKNHYSSKGVNVGGFISVNLVQENMLEKADYVGLASAKRVDKSEVFQFTVDEDTNMPIINDSPLTMICEVVSSFTTGRHENYILKPVNTLVSEEYLDQKGKIDFEIMSPILFDMQMTRYLSVGNEVAKCWNIGKKYME